MWIEGSSLGDHLPAPGIRFGPRNLFVARYNHECASINRIYGFYDECKRRYNIKLWKTYRTVSLPPSCCYRWREIFSAVQGLSPDLQSMEQIRRIMRPTDVPDKESFVDLWQDPDYKDTMAGARTTGEWAFPRRPRLVAKFHKHDLTWWRAHQVVEDGYEFSPRGCTVTLFSAPNYCGEFDNAGSHDVGGWNSDVLHQILKPADKRKIPTGPQLQADLWHLPGCNGAKEK